MATTTIPPDLLERIKKLFKMMSSEFEGERSNAATLLNRLLKANGISFNDIFGLLAAQPQPSPPPPPPAPKPSPTSLRSTDRGYEVGSDEMSELAEKIRATLRLDPLQSGVLTTLEDRSFKFPTVYISFAQMNVLQPMVRAMRARTR